MNSSDYDFPAVRGVQAGREYFLTMCPLRLLAMLFPDSGGQQPSEFDTRQPLDNVRVQEIAQYVIGGRDSYVISAIVASVDSPVNFAPDVPTDANVVLGRIRIPMSARLSLHDGRQRCAGLTAALQQDPSLGDESIAIVLFVDPGLKRSKQVFVDLKRHQRKPAPSQLLLHDNGDKLARVTRQMIRQVPVFDGITEMVRTTISNRSRTLFTLSAIYHATESLLADRLNDSFAAQLKTAIEFWKEVTNCIPDWQSVANGQIAPAELRKGFVHAHGLALAALARVGRALLVDRPKTWQRELAALKSLDWSRKNTKRWEGRALIRQRISKATTCVVLTLGENNTSRAESRRSPFRRPAVPLENGDGPDGCSNAGLWATRASIVDPSQH